MTMLNERDGGIGGIKINFEECETGYYTEKGVECYEKTKASRDRDAALVHRHHAAGPAEDQRGRASRSSRSGYGFSPMADGRSSNGPSTRRPPTGTART